MAQLPWTAPPEYGRKAEGSQLYEKIVQLKMKSSDGKRYLTDVANAEQLLRIIQSILSPKAQPFKIWLAAAGSERKKRESTQTIMAVFPAVKS